MNKDFVYLGCTNSMAKLLGLESRQAIIGKTYSDLFDAESAAHYKRTDEAVMKKGTPILLEEPLYYPDGRKEVYLSTKVPLRDLQGEIMGMLGVSIDITARKKMELDLQSARKKAEAANRAKDEFIRNMSHDIRTPLSGIVGMSSLLEQGAHTQEEKEQAHMLNISGEQLLHLLNGVLDIVATGNHQEYQLNEEECDIHALIHHVIDLELPTITLKQISLQLDLDDHLPQLIRTDSTKLHRILLNLLGNAVKFTHKGLIKLSACLIYKKNTHICNMRLKIRVCGIKQDDIKHIFKNFIALLHHITANIVVMGWDYIL